MTMDAKGFVVLPGQGPVWDMAPGRSPAFKMQRGETGENVMMFEEATPAGTVTPYHLHNDSDEITYVLSGEMTFKIGDEVTVGGPGTSAFMPRGIAHAWKNTGLETGRALFVFTPGAAGNASSSLTAINAGGGSLNGTSSASGGAGGAGSGTSSGARRSPRAPSGTSTSKGTGK